MEQMNIHIEQFFVHELSGFRKGHNCQHVLLKFLHDTYTALDSGDVTGAVLTDLSKAFDCLPYCLLVAKFKAYGFTDNACGLFADYFSG